MYLASGAPFQSLTMEFRLASNEQCPVSTYQVMTLKTCTITPSTRHMPYNSDIINKQESHKQDFYGVVHFPTLHFSKCHLLSISISLKCTMFQICIFALNEHFIGNHTFFSISVSWIQRVNHKYTSCTESYSTGLILSLIFMYPNQKISSFASLKVTMRNPPISNIHKYYWRVLQRWLSSQQHWLFS